METLKEKLKQIRKQDVLLWIIIAVVLFLTLHGIPPHERWESGRRILLLTVLLYYTNRNRKKI